MALKPSSSTATANATPTTLAPLASSASEQQQQPKTTKTKKKHFIGQKAKLFAAGEPLLNVLMWGVAHTVSDLSALPAPAMLLPDDFKAHCKLRIDNHLFVREHLPSRFKFKEYCPVVFRDIRDRFGLDDHDYSASLTRGPPARVNPADDRIFLSCDRRLAVKTVSGEDVSEIHNILKRYHQFVVECHGQTLLPQFLGMYKLTVEGVDTFAVVTRNVFGRRRAVHRKYDLKGSTVAREASPKERAKPLPTLKDVDFLRVERRLHLSGSSSSTSSRIGSSSSSSTKPVVTSSSGNNGDNNKQRFLEKLRRDVDFLATSLKVMDYRLLLGIHDVERGESEEAEGRSLTTETGSGVEEDTDQQQRQDRTSPGGGVDGDLYAVGSHERAAKREVYFMAIVGILTPYDARKKAAHAAKTVKHGAHADISTVDPDTYAKRFLEFLTTIL